MAWKARVLDVRGSDNTRLQSSVEVGFYDTADPRNSPLPVIFLHRVFYSSDQIESVESLIAMVQSEGQRARAAYERVQSIYADLPIGAEVEIT